MNDPTPPRMTDQAPELLPWQIIAKEHAEYLAKNKGDPKNERLGGIVIGLAIAMQKVGLTRPTPAERPVPQVREALPPTQEYFLRAMATNYAGGHRWDDLDSQTCVMAADEIKALRAALTARPSDARTVFPEDDWSERDKELADWFNALPCRDEEHWDALMRILCERPSDTAMAWRYRHKDTEGWSMLKNGRDPTEWLKQWTTIEYDIQPLYALPPDEPARVKDAEIARLTKLCESETSSANKLLDHGLKLIDERDAAIADRDAALKQLVKANEPFGYLMEKSGIGNGYYFLSVADYQHVEERFREHLIPVFTKTDD